MDLSVLQAADNAVKKLQKDYKPILEFADLLEELKRVANELLGAEAKQAVAERATRDAEARRISADAATKNAEDRLAAAKQALDAIKSTLSAVKL